MTAPTPPPSPPKNNRESDVRGKKYLINYTDAHPRCLAS